MDEQLTAQQEQEYVEARWKRVAYHESGLTSAGKCYVTIDADDHPTAGTLLFMHHGGTKAAVFHAAYLYTKERKRQIAEVEEKVALLEAEATLWPNFYKQQAAYSRILAREQAALADLKRGLR